MIEKILIANRGEIAMRVIRTAKNIGYRTVAVYSEPDSKALHVLSAHEAVCIGPAAAGESYLKVENVIEAARTTAADAIHPGYGFLAENAEFVRACENAGILFIGPPADAMELMGSKRRSKIAMQKAGVPCIPGYEGTDQSDEALAAEGEKIGFPLMVKASAGGGGRGMRIVQDDSGVHEAIRNARAEALSTFGDGELILEKAIIEPRHIEIQVFADTHGNVIHLGERDCSIQRRHQKVVEEAPSPFLDEKLRSRMGEAAVSAARTCGYVGAGTVEFLVDNDKNFYFLEMNTRLQVEHPVTEMITGLDLVDWQIRVACGEKLPLTQEEVVLNGHAIEVRIYAEDARQEFLPKTGKILEWRVPERDGLRVDAGIQAGQDINAHYDPILAKVVAWGKMRDEARRRLASALQDTVLLGLDNNKLFLERIVRHPVFAAGDATTAFIDHHFGNDVSMSPDALTAKTLAVAGMLAFRSQSSVSGKTAWTNPAPYRYNFRFACEDRIHEVGVIKKDEKFTLTASGETLELEPISVHDGTICYVDGGIRKKAFFAFHNRKLYLDAGCGHFIFENRTLQIAAAVDSAGSGDVISTLNGVVVDVRVAPGDIVTIGQTLVIIEAMKMQHQMTASINGRVESVLVSAGEQIKPGQPLVKLIEEKIEGAA